MNEQEEGVELRFYHEASSIPAFKIKTVYKVRKDGVMEVSICYPGVEKMPHMPIFAMDFKLKKDLNQIRYYGNGPQETYMDRKGGGKIGVYKTTPDDSCTSYLIPQECGNRTEIRWLEVTNEKNEGLIFTKQDANLECSVLPYSVWELENAMHIHELPPINYTWVRIAAKQMGVGGDDRWGAPVHQQYLIDSAKTLELKFTLTNSKN